ncbi:hypothetical protein B0H10DRAFT_1953478 [Mycena sp. CBHHK59/15]|nr:hypothetical protein B0H10DRAFT_1953478 [Mycena sp. CBHHK59/15]
MSTTCGDASHLIGFLPFKKSESTSSELATATISSLDSESFGLVPDANNIAYKLNAEQSSEKTEVPGDSEFKPPQQELALFNTDRIILYRSVNQLSEPVNPIIFYTSTELTTLEFSTAPRVVLQYTPADVPEETRAQKGKLPFRDMYCRSGCCHLPMSSFESDSEDDGFANRAGRLLEIPDQNAIPGTVKKARVLFERQKLLNAAVKQNKLLIAQHAQEEASKPGRRKAKGRAAPSGAKGPDPLGYLSVIIDLGKSFTVLHFPWVDTTVFSTKVAFPLVPASEIWKARPPSPLFPQQLTATVYKHVPERYHELVDVAGFPEFAANFSHHVSAEHSAALKTIKVELPNILLRRGLIKNVTDLKEWCRLVVLPEVIHDEKVKVSAYPPVIYRRGKKNPNTFMKSLVLTDCGRAILFGPASLQDNSSRRPQGSTLGQMWRVVKPTAGLMSFICTVVMFVCYWSSVPATGKIESFEQVGNTFKINFQEMYMRFRWALESKADEVFTKSVYKFWHENLFKGITGVPALPTPSDQTEDIDEEAELEDAMGDLDLDDQSLVLSEDEGEDLYAAPAAGPSIPAQRGPFRDVRREGQGRQEHVGPTVAPANGTVVAPRPQPRPQVHFAPAPGPAPAPGTDSDENVDESVESLVRPSRRGQGRIVLSDDEDEQLAVRPREAGGRAELDMVLVRNMLKTLRVPDLRNILTKAQQPVPSKPLKDDLITCILASNAAIEVYKADHLIIN